MLKDLRRLAPQGPGRSIQIMGLLLMGLAASAFAAPPTKSEIVAAKATYSGVLTRNNGAPWANYPAIAKSQSGAPWACTATVIGEGVVRVKWFSNEVTYKGEMGPAGGKAGAPLTMNAKGDDNSEVRFQWPSANQLQVEWWPDMAAKAGQVEHKPAFVKGTISKK